MLLTFGLILFSIYWFFDQIFSGYLFCFMDLTRYFYPYRLFMVESIRSGFFPLWNPFIYAGYPFFATLQAELLYPLSIIYFLMPFDQAFNWFVIIHYPLAVLFMYLFLRDIKLSMAASVVGGLSFAYSGYLNSVLHMPTSLSSVIWLPLIVLFFRRAIGDFKLINWGLLSIFLSIMFLGGEPSVLYATILFLSGYLLIDAVYNKNIEIFLKRAISFAAVVAFSLAIVAVQLLPFIELIMHSVRMHGLSYAEASHWSLSPRDLVSLVIPYFYNLTPFPFVNTDWLKIPYLGTIPLLLSISIIVAKFRSSRQIQILLSGFIISIVLAMGKYTPIYYIFYKILPGFSMNRYPVKYLFMTTFISAILAAFGMEYVVKTGVGKRLNRVLLSIGGFILIVGLVAINNFSYVSKLLIPLFRDEVAQGFVRYLPGLISKNIINFVVLGLFIIAFCLINNLRGKINKKLLIISLLVILAFDLAISNRGSILSIKINDYHKVPGNISYLMNDPDIFRVFIAPTMAQRSQTEVASEFADYSRALYSMRNRIPANQNMLYRIQLFDAYESIKGARQDAMINKINNLDSFEDNRILDVLNVKYLVSPWPVNIKGFKIVRKEKELIKTGDIYLYKNNNCLPRAFVVPSAVKMKQSDMLDYMCSRYFNPEEVVLLEEAIPKIENSKSINNTKIVKYLPNEIEIKVSGPGLLFLSDSYYPGWRAFVDDKESKIYRANYMFRAVLLSKGLHKVKFVYYPLSFTIGLIISTIAVGFLFVGFIILRRKK